MCICEPRLGPGKVREEELVRMQNELLDYVIKNVRKESEVGDFNISITATGAHGCDRKAKAGEKLFNRCGKFNCPDCMVYEFVQQLKQKGMLNYNTSKAELTHWPGQDCSVVDDLLKNERKSGQF